MDSFFWLIVVVGVGLFSFLAYVIYNLVFCSPLKDVRYNSVYFPALSYIRSVDKFMAVKLDSYRFFSSRDFYRMVNCFYDVHGFDSQLKSLVEKI